MSVSELSDAEDEQRTENPCVPGSIPGGTTKKRLKIMKSAEIQAVSADFFVFLNTKSRRFMK